MRASSAFAAAGGGSAGFGETWTLALRGDDSHPWQVVAVGDLSSGVPAARA